MYNCANITDDIFKCLLFKTCIVIQILLMFVTKGPMYNRSPLVQMMTRRCTGGKPLYEPMMTQFTVACMRLSATMYYVMGTPLHTAHGAATLYLKRVRPKLAQLQCGNVYLHGQMI